MRRREVIRAIAIAAASGSVAAMAQPSDRTRIVGMQMATSEQDPNQVTLVAAFVAALVRLGWRDGGNLRIEYRWGEGDPNRVRAQATELAGLAPDVIFCQGLPTTVRLRQATSTIPIVFVNVSDPVGSGIVESLAHPGGNLTGFTNFELSMGGKWLEILRELQPRLSRVLIIFNPDNPAGVRLAQSIEALAPPLGIQGVPAPARSRADLEQSIDAFGPAENSGLMTMPDFIAISYRDAIIERANRHKAPSIFPLQLFTTSGGLAAYGPDQTDTFRRAAAYVDRILRGTNPRDLPVQAPTKFALTINLKTAKSLGLTVPPTLLALADEVIE